jgi:hypothetical protein
LSSFIASSQAKLSPDSDGFGGVCGRVRLNAASSKEAMPAATYVWLTPLMKSSPVFGVLKAVLSQVFSQTIQVASVCWAITESTRDQSVRMKTNGRLAAIQPIVPQSRTLPKSC